MKSTPAQLANLRPQFKVGNPGGPGRPKKRPLSEATEDLLRRKAPEAVVAALRKLGLPNDATNADVLAICLFKQGLEGSTFAIKEMREAVEGRAPFRVELLSHEETQVNINVTFENLLGHKHAEIIDVESGSTDVTKELPDRDGEAE